MATVSVLARSGLLRRRCVGARYRTAHVPSCCCRHHARAAAAVARPMQLHTQVEASTAGTQLRITRPRGPVGVTWTSAGRRWASASTVDYRVEPLIPIQSVSVVVVASDLENGNARYLDCRSEEEYAAGVVPGSINLPYPHNGNREPVDAKDFLEDVLAEGFQHGEKIYLGCRKGPRSAMACEVLINAGFTCVFNVEGGIQEWVSKGLPIHPFTG